MPNIFQFLKKNHFQLIVENFSQTAQQNCHGQVERSFILYIFEKALDLDEC